mgnify:CR=1 FL=1
MPEACAAAKDSSNTSLVPGMTVNVDFVFLERKAETPAEMLRGLGEVLRNPALPFILALNFCNYACTFTVQGLWGGAVAQLGRVGQHGGDQIAGVA